jgi:hypothetical protein
MPWWDPKTHSSNLLGCRRRATPRPRRRRAERSGAVVISSARGIEDPGSIPAAGKNIAMLLVLIAYYALFVCRKEK